MILKSGGPLWSWVTSMAEDPRKPRNLNPKPVVWLGAWTYCGDSVWALAETKRSNYEFQGNAHAFIGLVLRI